MSNVIILQVTPYASGLGQGCCLNIRKITESLGCCQQHFICAKITFLFYPESYQVA